MKVISTNVARPKSFLWNGETHTTGIYKTPVNKPIKLEKESVVDDVIADRKVHGGIFKACYLFSADHYPYWKKKYPNLDWDWGMFGENLTVKGLNESELRIGNIYRLGTALVQITQPREPCYKLGVKFGTQEILRQFIEHGHPGTYVRILEVGEVSVGDTLELVEESSTSLTTKGFYELLFARKKDPKLLQLAIENEALPVGKRERLKKFA
ncbi:MOSC domain-containing protein [Flagellimonas allohymeniacidonis]|uniref:MOSC domain-containing protein n=1 Tax=Flagellimonas allohymeniacidonis TaxID=2517819 RepID=A0A4Q8Q8U4_9FLAO|nr:MOSC domain-containing protein [Allomuricauda hymeniacidonis]TAI46611.1 MOSC domain-containing protein [Allomuricauda hymeniacidonis]